MIRHEYSYFICISPVSGTGQTPDGLVDALGKSEISTLQKGPIEFTLGGDNIITGEVDPCVGTVEQTGTVEAEIIRLSKAFPDYLFELNENDEEDHSIASRTVFLAGEAVQQQAACTLSPGEAISMAGRSFVASALRSAGYTEAAAFVDSMPTEWTAYGQKQQEAAAPPNEGKMDAILAKPLDFTMPDETSMVRGILGNRPEIKTIGDLYGMLNTFYNEDVRLGVGVMYALHRFLIESILKELAGMVGDTRWESASF